MQPQILTVPPLCPTDGSKVVGAIPLWPLPEISMKIPTGTPVVSLSVIVF